MRDAFTLLSGVVIVLASLMQGSAPAAGAAAGFDSALSLPASKDGNEPSIAISSAGVRFVSWQAPGDFDMSSDGINFSHLGVPDANAIGDVTNAVDASGAIYNAQVCGDAQNALHTCIYRRLNRPQAAWTKTELADMHPGAADRPWIDVFPHHSTGIWNPDQTTVFLEYHTFSPDDYTYVTVSKDGGKTFSIPAPLAGDADPISSSTCNTIPGGISVDDKTGDVYAVYLSGEDAVQNAVTGCNYSEIGPFTKAWVASSTDGGTTWTSHLVWHGAYDPTTNIGDNASKLFPSVSVDQDGMVHVLLSVRTHDDPLGFVASCETGRVTMVPCSESDQPTHLLLTSSPDKGVHWTPLFQIDRDRGSYFFPWVAAGSGGSLDAIYYKSSTLKPNDPSNSWYAAMSQITGADPVMQGGSAKYRSTPVATETMLSTSPVHKSPRGGICSFGLFCAVVPSSNRDLADSIALAIDPAGGANAVWTNDGDLNNKTVQFACQSSGPSAFAGGPALTGCYDQSLPSASTKVLGARSTRAGGRLPATGVGDAGWMPLLLMALAAFGGMALRRLSL